MEENGPKWLSTSPQVFSFNISLLISLSISLTIFLSQSFFQNLLSKSFFTIFVLQSFFHNLSFAIFLLQSFFHSFCFTIFLSQSFSEFLSQSFFHNLSFTIFLSQSFFHKCVNPYKGKLFDSWSFPSFLKSEGGPWGQGQGQIKGICSPRPGLGPTIPKMDSLAYFGLLWPGLNCVKPY